MFAKPIAFCALAFVFVAAPLLQSAELPKEVVAKIDAAVASAYQAAAAKLPCKIGTTGKARMLRWQDVDKCLDRAQALIRWDELSQQLSAMRPPAVSEGDFASAVENSLSRHALPYNKVFRVKDEKALLPLTNPILKYLPPKSLQDLPVYEQSGTQIGTFAGVYSYERAGELIAGTISRRTLFQYADMQGKLQVPQVKLLLDSFGVPWAKAMEQPGFRLTSDKLTGFGGRR
jgi:hypothetical protein